MTSLTSSVQRLRQRKSLISPHLTSSMVLSERKEVVVIWARWESKMKVEPDLLCLGVTENNSSMAPVWGEPAPALSLILAYFKLTFSGRTGCSCQNRTASAAGCAPTSKTSRSASPATWRWICLSRVGWRTLCPSTANGSMTASMSIPPMPPPPPIGGGTRIFWGPAICRAWGCLRPVLHQTFLGRTLLQPREYGELGAALAFRFLNLRLLPPFFERKGLSLAEMHVMVKGEGILKNGWTVLTHRSNTIK